MKVLYLTPWYPSAKDQMAGLFVQKHVESIQAQGVDVRVIHSQGWRDLWQQWKQLKRTWGLPDLVQLNVIQKQGLLALWLKMRYKIPFLIVEHWSGYLPESGQFMQQSTAKRRLARSIAEHASCILTVSQTLENAMKQCGIQASHWGHINNIVDEFFYQGTRNKEQGARTLLHVSCFDERAKNTTALLQGFSVLCQQRTDIHLVMVGTGVDWLAAQRVANDLHIPSERITWTGEQTPQQVCDWMQKADAFVLTSRYETAGVVLSEAAAVGIPILSTPVGIAPQLITPQTGILISQAQANNPNTLSQTLVRIVDMNTYPSTVKEYRFSTVGKQLTDIYDSCLHRHI
ncbi:MAG: glycosyltransferase [Paludibacteraceae bacterium]|nr:glycosyltransferase [Paludibacteraceae bacterium]